MSNTWSQHQETAVASMEALEYLIRGTLTDEDRVRFENARIINVWLDPSRRQVYFTFYGPDLEMLCEGEEAPETRMDVNLLLGLLPKKM